MDATIKETFYYIFSYKRTERTSPILMKQCHSLPQGSCSEFHKILRKKLFIMVLFKSTCSYRHTIKKGLERNETVGLWLKKDSNLDVSQKILRNVFRTIISWAHLDNGVSSYFRIICVIGIHACASVTTDACLPNFDPVTITGFITG